mmetsp:Transcript_96544/g.282186  ORF Transcript_96544/g.282186 Transcript_96544/m.282186 type:complete len:225 (+) Transcript_96544:1407-2081(+)
MVPQIPLIVLIDGKPIQDAHNDGDSHDEHQGDDYRLECVVSTRVTRRAVPVEAIFTVRAALVLQPRRAGVAGQPAARAPDVALAAEREEGLLCGRPETRLQGGCGGLQMACPGRRPEGEHVGALRALHARRARLALLDLPPGVEVAFGTYARRTAGGPHEGCHETCWAVVALVLALVCGVGPEGASLARRHTLASSSPALWTQLASRACEGVLELPGRALLAAV